jgi:hypothetical protein
MALAIPPITDGELLEAVAALTRAADSYRSVLFLVMKAHPETWETVLKHEDLLHLSDAIINTWRRQLGQDDEDKTQPDSP